MSAGKRSLKIGYFGDGPWAHDALKRLLADKHLQVVFVSPRFRNPDPVLTSIAKEAGVEVLIQENVNAPESLGRIRGFSPDLLVSMSYDQIVRQDLIKLAPLGFINCHAGKLPFYRGRNILNWALINNEKSFGVTVHYIDDGIDTGPIIAQKVVPIDPDDDYGSILKKAQAQCGPLLHSAIDLLRRGRAKPRAQSKIHPVGFYCGRRRAGDELIDWGWTSARIHHFVRGVAPPAPAARTHLEGREIAILKTAVIAKAPIYIGCPGEIVGRDAVSTVVKTGDSTLRIVSIADVDESGAVRNPRPPKLRIGERLGIDLNQEVLRLAKRIKELEDRLSKSERAA